MESKHPDKTEIMRALAAWFRPGDVFEIRALNACMSGEKWRGTISGYFDYEHIRSAADYVGRIREYDGVYVTINPVKKDLIARACNRIRPIRREPTTSDAEVERRRWFLVDCDAERPSGICSTDEEHAYALRKAEEIRNGLATLGWPQPVMLDSGNGAQMTYLCDMPADDGGLFKKALSQIAKASDEHVKVDLTVFNAARIWRLPGTWNRKGDDTPDRPHRMARILSVPGETVCVTRELLEDIAGDDGTSGEQPVPYAVESGFDLDSWIALHIPDARGPFPYRDGRKWRLKVCPFNEAHTNGSAVITESADGRIGFRCLHNGCSGNDWRKLRGMLEPGCYDGKSAVYPDVDLSGLLGKFAEKREESAEAKPAEVVEAPAEEEEAPIVRPWDLVKNDDISAVLKDTILGDLCKYYASATIPPLPLEISLLKAIVSVACALSEKMPDGAYIGGTGATGRGPQLARLRIDTAGGQVCNAYAMTVGQSASGKDIGNLLETAMENYGWNLGTSGSAEGILDALVQKPNGLQSISELKNWLDPKHYLSRAADMFTEMFSKGYFKYNLSRRLGCKPRETNYAYPNVYANIQPDVFAKNVKMTDVTSGFLGRFLMVNMPDQFFRPAIIDIGQTMMRIVTCLDIFRRKTGVVTVPELYLNDTAKLFEEFCPRNMGPSWRRLVNEYGPRFAVMLSVTRDPETQGPDVILTERCWEGASKMILWFFAHAEKLLVNIMDIAEPARERERMYLNILKVIRRFMPGGARWSDISNYASYGTTKEERADALSEMADRGWIKTEGAKCIVVRNRSIPIAERYYLGNLPAYLTLKK